MAAEHCQLDSTLEQDDPTLPMAVESGISVSDLACGESVASTAVEAGDSAPPAATQLFMIAALPDDDDDLGTPTNGQSTGIVKATLSGSRSAFDPKLVDKPGVFDGSPSQWRLWKTRAMAFFSAVDSRFEDALKQAETVNDCEGRRQRARSQPLADGILSTLFGGSCA